MKISIVTLYNYTGRQVILNNNALNEEDILNEMLNDEDDSAGNWQSYRIPILYQRKEKIACFLSSQKY